MDILSIPFHRFLNIEKSDEGEGFIFRMEERPEHLNHLGTIHACAQLALAEASSGEFLLEQFGDLKDSVIPLIRKTEVKYSKPANATRNTIPERSRHHHIIQINTLDHNLLRFTINHPSVRHSPEGRLT